MERLHGCQHADVGVKIVWDKEVTHAFTSSEGSGGVCFLQTPRGTFVVKGSMQVVEEFFSCLLLQSLEIPVARMRVVNSNQEEWISLKHAIRNCIAYEQKQGNQTSAQRLKNILGGSLQRAQLMIIEFVEGSLLEGNQKISEFLSLHASLSGAKLQLVKQRLLDLGSICMMDVYLNNSDRFPLPCWDNEGNAGNLMISELHIVAIDSTVTTLDVSNPISKKRFTMFLEKVETMLHEIFSINTEKDGATNSSLISIKTFVLNNTGYEMSIEELMLVRQGMIIGIEKIIGLGRSRVLKQVLEYVSNLFPYSWENGWQKGVEKIRLDYFTKLNAVFKKVATKFNKSDTEYNRTPQFVVPPSVNLTAKDRKYTSNVKSKSTIQTESKNESKDDSSQYFTKKKPRFVAGALQAARSGLKKQKMPVEKKVLEALENKHHNKTSDRAVNESLKLDQFFRRLILSENKSKMISMERNATFQDLLEISKKERPSLVVFDFDQTLTEPRGRAAREETLKGPRLRGGKSSKEALKALHLSGVDMLVLTATKPGIENAKSVASEIRSLGLGKEFQVELDSGWTEVKDRYKQMGPNSSLSNFELTRKLVILLLLKTKKRGLDLWRLSRDGIEVDSSNNPKMIRFRTETQNSNLNDFSSLGGLSNAILIMDSAQDEASSLSKCMKEYIKRVEHFKHEPLLIDLDGQDDFTSFPMTSKKIMQMLEDLTTELKLSARSKRVLSHGFAEEITCTGSGVKITKAGKLICSGYNKPEALQWYIEQAGSSKSILFVDDSTSNVFNIFMAFKSNPVVEKVISIWFEPPMQGHHESVDPFIHNLVKRSACFHKINQAYIRDTIHERYENVKRQQKHEVTILLIQTPSCKVKDGMQLLREKLRDSVIKIDFVILPEGFIQDRILTENISESLEEFCLVAREFNTHIICGSMKEPADNNKFYTTCVLIGPDGNPLGKYRKRRIHISEVQASGDKVGVFSTKHGKIGILICLDSEDDSLVEETIEAGAKIIFNPTHIPTTTGSKGRELQVWHIALKSMQRRFEKICHENKCHILRCDTSYPYGIGSSQVIGPVLTETISSYRNESALFSLETHQDSKAGLESILKSVPSNSYVRTAPEDNIGPRIRLIRFRSASFKGKYNMQFLQDSQGSQLVLYENELANAKTLHPITLKLNPIHADQIKAMKSAMDDGGTSSVCTVAFLDESTRYLFAIFGNSIELLEINEEACLHLYKFLLDRNFISIAVDHKTGSVAAKDEDDTIILVSFW